MMGRAGLLAALLVGCTLASPRAEGAFTERFAEANAAYEAGDYEGAVDRFAALVDDGVVHRDLYYNLGNAHFKTGRLGRAVLWYERARRIDPRDEDVRENLELARSLLRDQELVPTGDGVRSALLAWHRATSTRESVMIVCALYSLLALVVVLFVFRRAPWVEALYRRVSAVSPARLFGLDMTQDLALAIALVGVLTGAFAFSAYTKIADERGRAHAVVVAEEVTVFSGPSRDATAQFKVHEGALLKVRDERSGWVRVDLRGDLSGWMDAGAMERI